MRSPALIPLSREHHYALVFCRTVRHIVEQHVDDPARLARWVDNARNFFALDLRPHFDTEEQVLFPASRAVAPEGLIDQLLDEHRAIESAVQALRDDAPATLAKLASMLEAHIRREERELFPRIDADLDPGSIEQVRGAVEARLGRAEAPRDLSLIEESNACRRPTS